MLSCQWKVCYNKLKQENFQKTDVGDESRDICQDLAVTTNGNGHTKSFFFFEDIWEIVENTVVIGQCML